MSRFPYNPLLLLPCACALLLLCVPRTMAADTRYPTLTDEQVEWIGQRIYGNECGRQPACLTAWNAGEDFPSLGIGHFIWYRADQQEIYEETFPALLRYLENRDIAPPAWIAAAGYDNPWPDRDAFLADIDGRRLTELRSFLQDRVRGQTSFIIDRFETAFGEILASASRDQRQRLEERFLAVANSAPPYGLYALIDYTNFKGTGVSEHERYQGRGWGLTQVLLNMSGEAGSPLHAFVRSAREVLADRVENAPPERNEQRWLAGWFNRLDSYLPATDARR